MDNEISNEYIENAINELDKFFGVKEPILGENIFSLIRDGKIKNAMKLIAHQLDLPIEINIINVPNDYREQGGENQFHSTGLTKVHKHGSGSEGITAQVSIPGNLPFYGSSALNGFPINVKISKNSTEHPVAFTTIMAHELAHVLLYSLNHSKKENEFYTDLTAIMLGFQNIFQNGRKITKTEVKHGLMSTTTRTQTTTYGYLNDTQFNFAHNKINSIIEENRERKNLLSKQFKKFIKILSRYKKMLYEFKKFLEYLTKHTDKKISGEDGKKIMEFFQLGYTDELEFTQKKYTEKQKLIRKFLEELSHYTDQRVGQLSTYTDELKTYTNELRVKITPIKINVRILKKYVDYKYRLKLLVNYYINLLLYGNRQYRTSDKSNSR